MIEELKIVVEDKERNYQIDTVTDTYRVNATKIVVSRDNYFFFYLDKKLVLAVNQPKLIKLL